jgi:hypothetical protein
MFDDDHRGITVLSQPELFYKILSYCTLEAIVGLYKALNPWQRDLFFSSSYFPRLVKIHNLRRKPDGVYLDLDAGSSATDFASFVRFLHLHQHSIPVERTMQSEHCYLTNVYQSHNMLPPTGEFLVVSCTFLPSSAPGKFSSNLAVLGMKGELLLFAPTDYCFRKTAEIDLDLCASVAHTLIKSPLGHSLLVATYKEVFWMKLSEIGVEVTVDAAVLGEEFTMIGEGCFVDEDSYLVVNRDGHVCRQQRTESGEVKCSMFRQGADFVWIPSGSAPYKSVTYKRPAGDTPGCVVVTEKIVRRGLGQRMKLLFDDRSDVVHLTFQSCIIAAHLIHPDQECMFVVVVTVLTRRQFLSSLFLPLRKPGEALAWWDRDVTGQVGVYQVSFVEGGEVVVRPRWFLNEMLPRRMSNVMYDDSRRLYLHAGSEHMNIKACLDRTHLAVMLDHHNLAHLPLSSGPDCTIVYERREQFSQFCFSDEHTFGAFFKGCYVVRRDLMKGTKMCGDFNDLCGDVNRIKFDESPCSKSG